MAKKFVEVVFEAHYNTVRGYIEGMLAGIGRELEFYFCSDYDIDSETFAELLKDWISLGNKIHHVVMEEDLYLRLKEALARAGESALLKAAALKSEKPVQDAHFDFKFAAYGKKYGAEIKAILADLPAGLSLSDYEPKERVYKEDEDEGVYTPAHDYEFEGEGRITGPIDRIIGFRKQLDDHPLIEAGRIKLCC